MDLAKFIREHCQEPGHTFEWVIENFSQGKVTRKATPEEFNARLNALYAARKRIARYVEQLSDGTERIPEKRYCGHGVRRDGKANHAGIIMVVKVGEVGS